MPGVRDHQRGDRRCDHPRQERSDSHGVRRHDEGPDHHRLPVLGQGRRRGCAHRVFHRRCRPDGEGPARQAPGVRRCGVRDHRPVNMRPSPQGRLPREFQRLQLPQDLPAHHRDALRSGGEQDRRVHHARPRRRHNRDGDVHPRVRAAPRPAGHSGIRAPGYPHVMLHALQAAQGGQGRGGERVHPSRAPRGQPRRAEADGGHVHAGGPRMARVPGHQEERPVSPSEVRRPRCDQGPRGHPRQDPRGRGGGEGLQVRGRPQRDNQVGGVPHVRQGLQAHEPHGAVHGLRRGELLDRVPSGIQEAPI